MAGEGTGLNRGDKIPFPDSEIAPGTGEMLCASGDPDLNAGERSLLGLPDKSLGDGDRTGLRGGVDCDVASARVGESTRCGIFASVVLSS